jgi:hypothetical protein
MSATTVRSLEPVEPGETWEALITFPDWADLQFDRNPATAAGFTIERAEKLSAAEVERFTGGRARGAPGLLVRMRNHGARPLPVEAWAIVTPNADSLRRQIERAAEACWSRGGDPITTYEIRSELAAAPPSFESDLRAAERAVRG